MHLSDTSLSDVSLVTVISLVFLSPFCLATVTDLLNVPSFVTLSTLFIFKSALKEEMRKVSTMETGSQVCSAYCWQFIYTHLFTAFTSLCNSRASFAAVSIAMSTACLNVRSGSVNSLFWIPSWCIPHTSRLRSASFNMSPNWQCSVNFFNSAN